MNGIIPTYVDNTDFKFLRVDDKFLCSIVIYDYPSKISFLNVIDNIPKVNIYDLSINIVKQDTVNILKKLTYSIASNKGELKSISNNQIDIDVINKVEDDAKKLRRDIQINNEQVFNITIIITFYSYDKIILFRQVKEFQNKLFSKQLISNILNFRQLQAYISTLPLLSIDENITKNKYKNITTSALSNMFCFYTKSVFDLNGIMFGYTAYENKLCNIDIFSPNYLNANICIFGSSGSGKSFFAKTLILRHFINKKLQFVFDLEGEYVTLVKNLNGIIITLNNDNGNYINILDITYNDLQSANYLENKIQIVCKFLQKCIALTQKDLVDLYESIKKAYYDKGINDDINSIYIINDNERIYINKNIKHGKYIPTMYDVLNNINDDNLKVKIQKDIIEKYPFISNHTNIDLDNRLWVFETSKLSSDNLALISEYVLNIIIDKIKINNINSIIYIDEIWKYISSKANYNLMEEIFSLYKTIRKYKGSIVTLTQDITDFFSIDSGNYGKSILNNSSFKIFFRLDYSDIEILKGLNINKDESFNKISALQKGQALCVFDNNSVILNIKSSDYEVKLMEDIDENYCSITK